MGLRPLVAGNWKMFGTRASLGEIDAMIRGFSVDLRSKAELLVCPPATLLMQAAALAAGSGLAIGAQDCHEKPDGAYTGSLSSEMLADSGATFVIVGHSERRLYDGDTDAKVRAKALAAARAGLTPIVCIGETQEERDAGRTLEVLERQIVGSAPDLSHLVIAYEPVWAIGTGRTPSVDDVGAAHAFIRERLAAAAPASAGRARILYGGSVKPGNAKELLSTANVDGALVGGASLKASDFLAIASAYLSS